MEDGSARSPHQSRCPGAMAGLAVPPLQAGPLAPQSHTQTATQAHHLFSHISASVAPTLGHSAPYISFSTSRMFCRVRNLVGLVS